MTEPPLCDTMETVSQPFRKKEGGLIPTKKKGQLLAVCSCGHFLVDLTCAFLMLSLSPTPAERPLVFLLYNFCAFALQMPLGLAADRLNRNGIVAASGLALTMAAFGCHAVPLLCALVLGLGNCLYHVGGGIEVLNAGGKKQWMLGVFVSPGAVGLFLGSCLAGGQLRLRGIAVPLLLLSLAVITALHLTAPLHLPSGNAPLSLKPAGRAPLAAAVCLFLVVVLRAYVGATLYTPWKNGTLLAVLALSGLVLGKAAGGFLADRMGALRTAILSLALCGVLFLFSEQAIPGILAIFLFNMTMPLTLFAMAKLFPGAPGFAFGSLTFALFLGSLPALLSLPAPFGGKVWIHAAEAAVSLLLLTAGLLACRERSVPYA